MEMIGPSFDALDMPSKFLFAYSTWQVLYALSTASLIVAVKRYVVVDSESEHIQR